MTIQQRIHDLLDAGLSPGEIAMRLTVAESYVRLLRQRRLGPEPTTYDDGETWRHGRRDECEQE